MCYLIGVDGGGTKTEAVAYDLSGNELAKGQSGFANVLVNPGQAIDHIAQAIRSCADQVVNGKCLYLYLGLAGIENGAHRDELEKRLKRDFRAPFSIVNDALIAHAGALKGQNGILTISGTGSISYGVKEGTYAFTGGWGHLLGDEGSGYWIAIQAFRHLIDEGETGAPLSRLSQALLKQIGIDDPQLIKSFVYGSSKAEIAALVPVVVDQALDGDLAAERILKEAGKELARTTLRLWKKLGFSDDVSIAMSGSVLLKIPLVQKAFAQEIRKTVCRANIMPAVEPPTKGAYYLAVRELKRRS